MTDHPAPSRMGRALDIGGAAVQRPSHVFFEEATKTLFCGDLCTQVGDGPAVTDQDLLEPAVAAEELFKATSLGPAVPATIRRLADLQPDSLAVMHGSSYNGDCPRLLRSMPDVYEQRFGCSSPSLT